MDSKTLLALTFTLTLLVGCSGEESAREVEEQDASLSRDAADGSVATQPLDAARARLDAAFSDAAPDDASADTSAVVAEGCRVEAAPCARPAFCPLPGNETDTREPYETPSGDHVILIKFVEGSHVRLRDGALVIDEAELLDEDPGLLCCTGLDVCGAKLALSALRERLEASNLEAERMFTRDVMELDEERAQLRATSGEYLSDLNLYYSVAVSQTASAGLLAELRASPVVDVAYLHSQGSLPGGSP